VFQNPVLFPWLNLQRNVEFALDIVGSKRAERATVASELIDLVGLKGFEEAFPNQLSAADAPARGHRPGPDDAPGPAADG